MFASRGRRVLAEMGQRRCVHLPRGDRAMAEFRQCVLAFLAIGGYQQDPSMLVDVRIDESERSWSIVCSRSESAGAQRERQSRLYRTLTLIALNRVAPTATDWTSLSHHFQLLARSSLRPETPDIVGHSARLIVVRQVILSSWPLRIPSPRSTGSIDPVPTL